MWDWDEEKRRSNLAKHGVDFAAVADFDWDEAFVEPDVRQDYGEVRQRATGPIGVRLCVLVYTRRAGRMRIISLRKANAREVARWRDQQSRDDR
ncbi:BrnT family toxin [Cereibacter changlensis]|uniref:BrnT family toxin n=1 Tax=Cereibacter changlensis TaxID=402884 RepID=UPI00403336A2